MTMRFARRSTAGVFGALAAAAASGALACVPATASAAVTNCAADANVSQPFAAWGDTNNYRLMPGGVFTTAGTNWTLTAGASVAATPDPLGVEPSSDSAALVLPAGASATSPSTCFDASDPTFRLMDSTGGTGQGALSVRFTYTFSQALLSGATRTFQALSPSLSYVEASAWAPSAIMQNGAQYLQAMVGGPLSTVSLQGIAITLTATSRPVSIDDVYLDPMGRWG